MINGIGAISSICNDPLNLQKESVYRRGSRIRKQSENEKNPASSSFWDILVEKNSLEKNKKKIR